MPNAGKVCLLYAMSAMYNVDTAPHVQQVVAVLNTTATLHIKL